MDVLLPAACARMKLVHFRVAMLYQPGDGEGTCKEMEDCWSLCCGGQKSKRREEEMAVT